MREDLDTVTAAEDFQFTCPRDGTPQFLSFVGMPVRAVRELVWTCPNDGYSFHPLKGASGEVLEAEP